MEIIEQLKALVAALDLEWWPTLITLYVVAGVKYLLDAVNVGYLLSPEVHPWMTADFAPRVKDIFWGMVACVVACGTAWVTTEVTGAVDTLGAGLMYGVGSVVIYLLADKIGLAEKLWLKAKPKE